MMGAELSMALNVMAAFFISMYYGFHKTADGLILTDFSIRSYGFQDPNDGSGICMRKRTLTKLLKYHCNMLRNVT